MIYAEPETISGVVPVKDGEKHFDISTREIESFMQKQLDAVVAKMNAAAENPKDKIDNMRITITAVRMSDVFYPLMLLMPLSVLSSKKYANNSDELSIFNTRQTSGAMDLKKPIWEAITPFLYDSDDRKSFFTPTYRSKLKISTTMAGNLKAYSRPKIFNVREDSGMTRYVVILLDVIRVIHYMTQYKGDNEWFKVDIHNVERLKDGACIYHLVRRSNDDDRHGKKRKKSYDNINNQLQNCLKGHR